MKKLIPAILFFSSLAAGAQCTFSLGPDVTYCQGQTISSVFSAPAGQSSYAWSTGATTQNITATAAGAYTCTVTLLSSNLVTNGNFTSGNTGFSSSYSLGAGGTWGPISSEGTYYVTNNANFAHSNFPSFSGHGGSGNMMVCNGSSVPGTSVWCTSITVTPNTNYNFSAWAATCVNGTAAELADLQFSINSATIGGQFSPSMTPGVWSQFSATWNSGANTTANICIVNQNTTLSGNDFALDDIFFQQVCTANDAVQVIVNPRPTVTVPANTTVCNGASVPASNFVSSPAGATYAWTNSNTAIGLAANGTGNVPAFTAANTGTSAISGVISVIPMLNGCAGNAANYTITVNPPPVLATVSSQTLCPASVTAAINFSSTPPGASVSWTNSDPAIGLGASGSGNIPSFFTTNPGTGPIVGTITATPTLNSCVGTPTSFSVVVNPAPVLSAVSSQTVCAGASTAAIVFVTNPASGVAVNWSNADPSIGLAANGAGAISSFTTINGTASSVNAAIVATPVAGTCTGSPQTFTITVDPAPVLNAVSSQTICVNSSTNVVTFTSNPPGAGVAWTNSDASIGLAASGSGDIAAFVGQNTGATALTGNIVATPTLNTCVGSPVSFDIIVSPAPVLSAVTSQTVCPGLASTAVSFVTVPAGIATINWTNSDASIGLAASGSGDIASFTAVNSTAAAIAAQITATPSIGICVGNPETFTITVNPAPTIAAVPNLTVCNADPVPASSFNGTSGASFDWTNSNPGIGLAASGTGNYAAFTATNTSASPETASISVTPVLSGCNSTPVVFSITVNPTPVPPSAPLVAPYCLNSTANPLTAVTGTGGSLLWWGTAASGGTSSATATVPSTGTVGTLVYYVSQTILGCESPRASITVTVNALPVITDPLDTTVCVGVSVPPRTFASVPAGASINWINNNPSTGLAASGSGDVSSFTASNAGTVAITSVVTVTPTLGACAGAPVSYSITVNPKPAIVSVSDITVCNTATVPSINWNSIPPGASYTWSNSMTSIGLAASGSGAIPSFTAVNTNTAAANSTINVTPTLNGCTGSASSFSIIVNPTPAAPAVTNSTYCRNDAPDALSPAGANILWYTAATGGAGSTAAPTPSTATAGTFLYYVSQRDANGCESPRSTVTVSVGELPSAALAPVSPACPPLCTRLALSSTDNLVSYTWALGDGTTFSGNDTVPNHCYDTGSYTVGVTIKDNNNCVNTVTFPNAVQVSEVPEAAFIFGPQPATILDPVVAFTNTSIGTRPMTFQWNFGTEPGVYVTTENPGYIYQAMGEYNVELVVTNAYGCSDTTYRTVVIGDDITIYIPNAFTPNGDGVNDSFIVQGVGINEKDFTMQIFDRWGEKIFQTNSLSEGWTGKVRGNPVSQEDVFIWKILYRSEAGDKRVKEGRVTLLR
jgi:gliding motility-associated-like protein